jgi:hypothetical protein
VCSLKGCFDDSIVKALYFAADSFPGVPKIVNISLGSYAWSRTLLEAAKYAHAHGVLIVAAAGNDGLDTSFAYPASLPGVLSVGATDADDVVPWWSNRGPGQTGIFAPGDSIISTLPMGLDIMIPGWSEPLRGPYGYMDGTSMAAPAVTGVAALTWAQWPAAKNDEIMSLLKETTDPIHDPAYESIAYGRVNAFKAVSAADRCLSPEQECPWRREAKNESVASARIWAAATMYYYYQEVLHMQGTCSEHDAGTTYLRLQQFDFSTGGVLPFITKKLETCGTTGEFSFDINVHLFDSVTPILGPYVVLQAVIEDRDSLGNLVDILPVSFSGTTNGYDFQDIGSTIHYSPLYGFLNRVDKTPETLSLDGWALNGFSSNPDQVSVQLIAEKVGPWNGTSSSVMVSEVEPNIVREDLASTFIFPLRDGSTNHGFKIDVSLHDPLLLSRLEPNQTYTFRVYLHLTKFNMFVWIPNFDTIEIPQARNLMDSYPITCTTDAELSRLNCSGASAP